MNCLVFSWLDVFYVCLSTLQTLYYTDILRQSIHFVDLACFVVYLPIAVIDILTVFTD